MSSSRRGAALAICLLLAIAHTWPLALHPGRYSLNGNADAQLNEWIMAWVAHQLPRDPVHLFEANIFYPAHDALAFSEPLIVPAVMGAPLAWAGASPVLVYNLVLIAGLALTAFAAWLLIERWTGSFGAGLLAGSVLAFNTHTLTRLAHIQGVHLYGLPLALLALDRLIRGGGVRASVGLAASLVVLAFTSGYLIVFAVVMIAVAVIARAGEWLPNARGVISALTIGALAAALLIVPLWLPYRRVARDQHMVRSLDVVRDFSATPSGYLATAARLHRSTWSWRFFKDPVDAFFPGFTVLALAAAAVVIVWRRTEPLARRRTTMLLAIAIGGFVLSLGTATPVYAWLFHAFPPMQGLRVAARFGNLFLLGIALLGGLGLAAWRPRALVAAALVLLVNAESLCAPVTYTSFTGVPGVYRLLAEEPGNVVVAEQPFYPRGLAFQNGPYVLASTAHWRPLMNGYSGYTPASYQQYADDFWYFPREHAIEAMKRAGVTHVVVHADSFARDRQDIVAEIGSRADLELLAVGQGVRLYRLKR